MKQKIIKQGKMDEAVWKMKKIQLYTGSEREQEFVQRGDSIVDFLSDPLRPCFVYENSEQTTFNPPVSRQHIAWNYGNFREAHRFKTFIGDLSNCWHDSDIYQLDTMADDKVLVKSTVRILGFYKHTLKVQGQNGFCELIYDGTADDIVKEFVERGYNIHEFFPERGNLRQIKNAWDLLQERLEEQRRNNMKKRTEEIKEHYRRKLWENET